MFNARECGSAGLAEAKDQESQATGVGHSRACNCNGG